MGKSKKAYKKPRTSIVPITRSVGISHDPSIRYMNVSSGGTVSTTGTFYSISEMAQGDNNAQRQGTNIELRKLLLNVTATGADLPGNVIRMILFLDVQNNATADANWSQSTLLYDTSYPWISPQNPLYSQRYHVLRDWMAPLNLSGQTVVTKKFSVNLKRFKASYAGSASGASINGALGLYVVSDSSVTTHPNFLFVSQLFYKE